MTGVQVIACFKSVHCLISKEASWAVSGPPREWKTKCIGCAHQHSPDNQRYRNYKTNLNFILIPHNFISVTLVIPQNNAFLIAWDLLFWKSWYSAVSDDITSYSYETEQNNLYKHLKLDAYFKDVRQQQKQSCSAREGKPGPGGNHTVGKLCSQCQGIILQHLCCANRTALW